MTREEVIEELEKVVATLDMTPKLYEVYYMIIKALEQEPKWTLASEKLPEKGGRYLVTRDGIVADTVYILSYSKNLYNVDKFEFDDKKGVPGWYDYDDEWGYISFDDVIAWMPLPEPYKAERDE